MNTFGWQRLEVVHLNNVEEESEEPSVPKRARMEKHSNTQLLHDGSEIGTSACSVYFSCIHPWESKCTFVLGSHMLVVTRCVANVGSPWLKEMV